VVDSALARIPVVGAQLGDEIEPLTGSTMALAIGLVGALWAGLGVTLALGRAFEQIWDVARLEQRGGIAARVRGLAVLTVIGVALIAATVLAGLTVGGRIGAGAERLGALGGALAVNLVGFFAVFALLTDRPVRVRELLPGVALAAVGALVLQSLGAWYVAGTVTRASDTYGTFALVIGLLSWFWLGSHLVLLAAELNVVLVRRLWPRALTGELGAPDRRALERNARAARRDERQRIAISFADGGAHHPAGTPDRPIAAAPPRREDERSPSVDREPPP
jgi:membrane protein